MEWFNKRERRGILIFLPLLVLIAVGVRFIRVRSAVQAVERIEAEEHPLPADLPADLRSIPIRSTTTICSGWASKSQAVQLLRYRAAGKVFRLPEELATLYGMSDSLFRRLRPWVTISEEYRYRPRPKRSAPDFPSSRRVFRSDRAEPFRIDTVSAAYLRSLGFSVRWSEAFVDCWRRRRMRSLDELREIAFIGDSITDLLAPFLLFPEREPDPYDRPVELNTADSASLCGVNGIGSRTAHAIVEYRRRLGGFHRVEQLAEVRGVLESNYEKIIEQISCDSFRIRKLILTLRPRSG